MRYLGGKCRLGKKIAEVINRYANMDKNYIEPFVGGFWVTQHVSNNFKNKYCYDINKYMIELYKALQKGWEPPVNITKEEYLFIRNNKDIDMALTAFAGIGCSFAGKWFGGYAKSAGGRNYCLNSYNSCNKIRHLLNNIIFNSINFKELNPDSAVIYCDPPYNNTTGYGFSGDFNSEEFWAIMRIWAKNNTVLISEYKAPHDFKCIAEFNTKTDIRNKNNQKEYRIEKLFTI